MFLKHPVKHGIVVVLVALNGVAMLTHTKNNQTHFRGLGKIALKQALLWQLVLFLTLTTGGGDRAFAQSASDSVIDRIPQSAAAVDSDRGDNLFLIQMLYAGAIVWIISLMVSGKN
jgi:threonine/homoserine efflux transporter RhtA